VQERVPRRARCDKSFPRRVDHTPRCTSRFECERRHHVAVDEEDGTFASVSSSTPVVRARIRKSSVHRAGTIVGEDDQLVGIDAGSGSSAARTMIPPNSLAYREPCGDRDAGDTSRCAFPEER